QLAGVERRLDPALDDEGLAGLDLALHLDAFADVEGALRRGVALGRRRLSPRKAEDAGTGANAEAPLGRRHRPARWVAAGHGRPVLPLPEICLIRRLCRLGLPPPWSFAEPQASTGEANGQDHHGCAAKIGPPCSGFGRLGAV